MARSSTWCSAPTPHHSPSIRGRVLTAPRRGCCAISRCPTARRLRGVRARRSHVRSNVPTRYFPNWRSASRSNSIFLKAAPKLRTSEVISTSRLTTAAKIREARLSPPCRVWVLPLRRRITKSAQVSTRSISPLSIHSPRLTTCSRYARSPSTSRQALDSMPPSCPSRSKNAPAADCTSSSLLGEDADEETMLYVVGGLLEHAPGDDRDLQSHGQFV